MKINIFRCLFLTLLGCTNAQINLYGGKKEVLELLPPHFINKDMKRENINNTLKELFKGNSFFEKLDESNIYKIRETRDFLENGDTGEESPKNEEDQAGFNIFSWWKKEPSPKPLVVFGITVITARTKTSANTTSTKAASPKVPLSGTTRKPPINQTRTLYRTEESTTAQQDSDLGNLASSTSAENLDSTQVFADTVEGVENFSALAESNMPGFSNTFAASRPFNTSESTITMCFVVTTTPTCAPMPDFMSPYCSSEGENQKTTKTKPTIRSTKKPKVSENNAEPGIISDIGEADILKSTQLVTEEYKIGRNSSVQISTPVMTSVLTLRRNTSFEYEINTLIRGTLFPFQKPDLEINKCIKPKQGHSLTPVPDSYDNKVKKPTVQEPMSSVNFNNKYIANTSLEIDPMENGKSNYLNTSEINLVFGPDKNNIITSEHFGFQKDWNNNSTESLLKNYRKKIIEEKFCSYKSTIIPFNFLLCQNLRNNKFSKAQMRNETNAVNSYPRFSEELSLNPLIDTKYFKEKDEMRNNFQADGKYLNIKKIRDNNLCNRNKEKNVMTRTVDSFEGNINSLINSQVKVTESVIKLKNQANYFGRKVVENMPEKNLKSNLKMLDEKKNAVNELKNIFNFKLDQRGIDSGTIHRNFDSQAKLRDSFAAYFSGYKEQNPDLFINNNNKQKLIKRKIPLLYLNGGLKKEIRNSDRENKLITCEEEYEPVDHPDGMNGQVSGQELDPVVDKHLDHLSNEVNVEGDSMNILLPLPHSLEKRSSGLTVNPKPFPQKNISDGLSLQKQNCFIKLADINKTPNSMYTLKGLGVPEIFNNITYEPSGPISLRCTGGSSFDKGKPSLIPMFSNKFSDLINKNINSTCNEIQFCFNNLVPMSKNVMNTSRNIRNTHPDGSLSDVIKFHLMHGIFAPDGKELLKALKEAKYQMQKVNMEFHPEITHSPIIPELPLLFSNGHALSKKQQNKCATSLNSKIVLDDLRSTLRENVEQNRIPPVSLILNPYFESGTYRTVRDQETNEELKNISENKEILEKLKQETEAELNRLVELEQRRREEEALFNKEREHDLKELQAIQNLMHAELMSQKFENGASDVIQNRFHDISNPSLQIASAIQDYQTSRYLPEQSPILHLSNADHNTSDVIFPELNLKNNFMDSNEAVLYINRRDDNKDNLVNRNTIMKKK